MRIPIQIQNYWLAEVVIIQNLPQVRISSDSHRILFLIWYELMNILIILFAMITFLIMASDPRAGDFETQASVLDNQTSAHEIARSNSHQDSKQS